MQRNVFRVTAVLSFLLNEEEVLRLLEEAYRERFSWLLYLPIEPAFDFLRSEPKFQNLISRLMPRLADQVTQS